MEKKRVLFLCVHNSARSQMAEAFLKKYAPESFEPVSAGLEPGKLNMNVVEAMKEVGIDISNNITKSVFDLYKNGEIFSYVVTVCSKEAAEKCPFFPGVSKRLHWPFDDPSSFTGSKEEIMSKTRKVRDDIELKIREFVDHIRSDTPFKDDDLFIITK